MIQYFNKDLNEQQRTELSQWWKISIIGKDHDEIIAWCKDLELDSVFYCEGRYIINPRTLEPEFARGRPVHYHFSNQQAASIFTLKWV